MAVVFTDPEAWFEANGDRTSGLRSSGFVQMLADQPVARAERSEAGARPESSAGFHDFLWARSAPRCLMNDHCRSATLWCGAVFTMIFCPKSVGNRSLWAEAERGEAAIIDATLIESAARPRSYIEAPQDRAEGIAGRSRAAFQC